MLILEKPYRKSKITQLILHHIELFDSFDNVYLFGSLVKDANEPEDVDLLLLYNEYSNKILFKIDKICTVFMELYQLTFDITVLSKNEEAEIDFISKLHLNHLKLK